MRCSAMRERWPAALIALCCAAASLLPRTGALPARTVGYGLNADLMCSVCETAVDLVEAQIAASEDKTVQIGFRLEAKKHTAFARSEGRVLEILENEIEAKFEEFGVVGQVPEKKLIHTRNLAPENRTNISESADERSAMRQGYQYLLHEHLEDMLALFTAADPLTKHRLCWDIAQACPAPAATFTAPPEAATAPTANQTAGSARRKKKAGRKAKKAAPAEPSAAATAAAAAAAAAYPPPYNAQASPDSAAAEPAVPPTQAAAAQSPPPASAVDPAAAPASTATAPAASAGGSLPGGAIDAAADRKEL